MSGIDLRKSRGSQGNIRCTLSNTTAGSSGSKWRRQAAAVWDWKWLLSADFSDFHSSETL